MTPPDKAAEFRAAPHTLLGSRWWNILQHDERLPDLFNTTVLEVVRVEGDLAVLGTLFESAFRKVCIPVEVLVSNFCVLDYLGMDTELGWLKATVFITRRVESLIPRREGSPATFMQRVYLVDRISLGYVSLFVEGGHTTNPLELIRGRYDVRYDEVCRQWRAATREEIEAWGAYVATLPQVPEPESTPESESAPLQVPEPKVPSHIETQAEEIPAHHMVDRLLGQDLFLELV